MKSIIVGFSSHKGIFSWLIRAISRSKVSHTYLRVPVPEYADNMVFQASGLQVNYCNYDVFQQKSEVIEEYEILVDDATYEYAELFRITEAGKPYSLLTVIGFLWILSMNGIKIKAENPFADGQKSYICVEVVANCLGLINIGEKTTPEDLRLWCAKYGKLIFKKS